MIRVALADDHELIRKGFIQILENNNFQVVADADNGKELIEKLKTEPADVVLMDINMPVMDGVKATAWLRKNMAATRVLVVSVLGDDESMIRMLKAGARGYLVKNAKTNDLVRAINDVHEKGYHFSDMVTSRVVSSINHNEADKDLLTGDVLTDRETDFLKLCCTEKSYKEIANDLKVSPRTVEGYGKILFEKLGLKSRTGLVLYAIRNHIVSI